MAFLKVAGFIGGYNGCGHFRFQQPFKHLCKNYEIAPRTLSDYSYPEIKAADVVYFQKQFDDNSLKYINYCKSIKKPVILEFDDLLTDVPVWNSAHDYYKSRKDLILQHIGLVDACIVSTDYLKEKHLPFNKNIHVIPNSIDFDDFKVTSRSHLSFMDINGKKTEQSADILHRLKNRTKIMWWGSLTHYKDFAIVEKTLLKLIQEFPDIVICLVGCVSDTMLHMFKKYPNHLVLVNSIATCYFHSALKELTDAGPTIAIAPIDNIPFNLAKSNLKVIEAWALGVPVVASYVGEYSKTIKNGLNGYLASNSLSNGIALDWYEKLKILITQPMTAQLLAKNGHVTVKKDYNIEHTVSKWWDVFSSFRK